jgi:flavin reductase (DIM6/NTAB) family NADH-FMN oxidoreductase RutF
MKKRLGPLERLFPMPCVLVVGGTMDEADTLAVAWINVVSSTPPTIAMGLRNTRRTLELIRSTGGSFTVNIPSTELAPQVDYCGIVGGRTADKFAATGLTLVPALQVSAPIIAECPYNIECRTTHEVEVGDYVIVFGEIVEVQAEENILREGSDNIVEMDYLDPLVYIAGAREYRGLGPKLHDAYRIGNAFRKGELDA